MRYFWKKWKKNKRFSFELNEKSFMADANRAFGKNDNNNWIVETNILWKLLTLLLEIVKPKFNNLWMETID